MNYKLLLLSLSFLYSTNGSLTPLQGSGTDCSQTISNLQDGDYGFLQSPSYPGSYRPGLDCEWRFKGAPGTVVVATVFDMRTQNAILSDISDSLYISLNGNWNDSQRFSGDLAPITPMVFVSEKNSFAVRFRSSQFTQGDKGFRIGYFVRVFSEEAKNLLHSGTRL